MGMKVKWMVIACMVLLFGLVFGSFVSFEAASAQVLEKTVTYKYYVVAGYEMEPTLPEPEPSWVPVGDGGLNFTIAAFKDNTTWGGGLYSLGTAGYNFGSITKVLGKTYLYEGEVTTPTGSAYAKMNITNLLGYDINITSLTAEVTAGTCTPYFWGPPGQPMGNHTPVWVDTFDPWAPENPKDEVNYYTGEVKFIIGGAPGVDNDWWTKACGEFIDYPEPQTGPGSLLEPDKGGDAEATGHVANETHPITLANGSTFTEYFGIIIFGDADVRTQIDGTITLNLTYRYEAPPGSPAPSFGYTPKDPTVGETVTFDASNSTANGGNITSYTWDFGDGANGTGKVVTHKYTTAGNYTVILNVTDTEGLSLTASESITVAAAAAAEFPWLWVAVGVVVVIVVVAAVAVAVRRRK